MIRYGKHAIESALQYPDRIKKLLVSTQIQKNPKIQSIIDQAKTMGVSIDYIPAYELTKRCRVPHHQGLVALVQDHDMVPFKQFLPNAQSHSIILALDHIQDPHNGGAMMRTSESFGVTALVFPKDRSCPITPVVSSASSGAIDHITCIEVTNLSNGLKQLKDAGFWIYGADSNTGQELQNTQFNMPMVLVMGNEGKGLGNTVQKQCDETVRIPLQGATSSLNVSVATGIMLHHISISPDVQSH